MKAKPTVVLTRPRAQNSSLQKKLADLGFASLIFPLLEIEKIPAAKLAEDIDFAIFTSPNAAHFFETSLQIPVFAIGSGTQKALAKKNIIAKIPEEFNSEALLALPELHAVQNKKIAIIGGENPRPLLANTLQQRGAKIENIFCYRRLRPTYSTEEMEKLVQLENCLIIITSGESLKNSVHLLSENLAWLYQVQLGVSSSYLSAQAQRLGFKLKPWVAANASDEALVELLVNCHPRAGEDLV